MELEFRGDVEALVNNGFDVEEFYVDCSPPHGEFLNGAVVQWISVLDCYFKDFAFVSHRGWNFFVLLNI